MTPVLVLGSGITALGVVRTLSRKGVPVFSLAPTSDRLVRNSRWYRPAPIRGRWIADDRLATNLERIEVDRAVLLPCTDAHAMEVARLPQELADRFPSFQPPADTLERMVDKSAFLEAIQAAGVPGPRTYAIDDVDGLRSLPGSSESRPLFIKPRDSQTFFRQYGVKGFHATDRSELEAHVREITAAGHHLIIQEYVPGPASNHFFVDGFALEGGRIAAHLVRRRVRMYPPDFGNSTLVVTVPPDEAAEAVSGLERLFRSVEYRGIFSAEFKRDSEDGVFRILEVNARPWWYIEFAARAGVDVAMMTYEAALDRRPAAGGGYRVGRKLVYPYYDLHACLNAYDSRTEALWHFARDGLGAEHAVFAWDDPLPAFRQWMATASGYIARRLAGRETPSR